MTTAVNKFISPAQKTTYDAVNRDGNIIAKDIDPAKGIATEWKRLALQCANSEALDRACALEMQFADEINAMAARITSNTPAGRNNLAKPLLDYMMPKPKTALARAYAEADIGLFDNDKIMVLLPTSLATLFISRAEEKSGASQDASSQRG